MKICADSKKIVFSITFAIAVNSYAWFGISQSIRGSSSDTAICQKAIFYRFFPG
jgi:hypothetical protein